MTKKIVASELSYNVEIVQVSPQYRVAERTEGGKVTWRLIQTFFGLNRGFVVYYIDPRKEARVVGSFAEGMRLLHA